MAQTVVTVSKEEERLGLLEIDQKNAFLRDSKYMYRPERGDPWFSPNLVRSLKLKTGQLIEALVVPGRRGGLAVKRVISVNGLDPKEAMNLKPFRDLTSISPNRRINLETTSDRISMRLTDLVCPIGMGTRGLIVAAPKTGKTTLLEQIAEAVTTNHPDLYLMALGIDERPEEATMMRRSIKGEVITSSLDEDPRRHRRMAQLMAAAARARVEAGQDVFLILDSITRLSRAFNQDSNSKGRTMSGGLDSQAMAIPRRIFGSARATEEAGSLTIIATALVDTGSRMDELIFQEFKGTGNMELVLERKLSDLRIWPAVNINESGTRHEELLQTELERKTVPLVRRSLAELRPADATQKLLTALQDHPDNTSFLNTVNKVA